MIKVFGRITAEKDDCQKIVKDVFSKALMCYEQPDSGCASAHCHFIAETERFKNIKSLRMKIADLTKNATGQSHQYSIKPYDPDKDAEAYICKGHKKDAAVIPEILINDYNEDIDDSRNRYHSTAQELKADRHSKPIWRDLVSYIQETNPMFEAEILKKHRVKDRKPAVEQMAEAIAFHLYDMMEKTDRAMPNPYLAKQAVLTAMSRLCKTLRMDIRKIISRSFIPNDVLFL